MPATRKDARRRKLREPQEPEYGGRKLTSWLDQYENGKGHAQTEAALGAIGTNAIPALLRMLRAHDSAFKLKLIALAEKQHLIRFSFTSAEAWNERAFLGFAFLGSSASNAVPALARPSRRLAACCDDRWRRTSSLRTMTPKCGCTTTAAGCW